MLNTLSSTVGQFYILYMAAKKVSNVFAEWYTSSNDYIENLNLFNVTMRDSADAAYEYAQKVESAMGIDISEWISYQGEFQQLAKGFGVASEQADIMSQNLTQLSYDLSSFFNVDVETASDKLSSAMAGQVKGLREYGIDVSNASLQSYALSKGIGLTVTKMTQAQKSALRYNYILEKTVDIQGDMARTLVTPSNSLRILSTQIDKLKRSLGNIVSMLVTKFIPYVQAVVMLISDFADSLAKKWGFELPTIDYSNLDDAVSVTEDLDDAASNIADDFADATDEVKKLKYQLMGFDELNILKSSTTSSTSKTKSTDKKTSNDYPSDLGLGVKSYDFGTDGITSQAKKIYNKLKKIFADMTVQKAIEKIFEVAKKGFETVWNWFTQLDRKAQFLIVTIAAVFAVKKIMSFISWVKSAYDTVTSFMGGVSTAEGMTGSLTRVALTAAGTIAAGFAGYDFTYDLVKGTLDWKNAILDIPLAVAGIGIAFATSGPIGAAIAAAGLLAGSFIGYATAMEDKVTEMVNDYFYDGLGTSITFIADQVTIGINKINEYYSTYNEKFSEMASNKKDIETIIENIGLIGQKMKDNVTDTKTGCDSILKNLADLKSSITTQTDAIYEAIYHAVGGAFGDAAEKAGISKDKILEATALTTAGMNQDAADVIEKITDLTQSYKDGEISFETFTEKKNEYLGQLSGIIGTTDEATKATDDFKTSLNNLKNIDFESETKRKDAFDKVKSSASDAKSSVNEYYDNLKSQFTQLRDYWKDKDNEKYNLYDNLINVNESTREKSLKDIDKQVMSFFEAVQNNVITEMGGIQDTVDKEWESMDWFSKNVWYKGNKERFASDFLNNYKNNVVSPIDSDIKAAMDELGIKGETYAADASKRIIDKLQHYDALDKNWHADFDGVSDAIDKELKKVADHNAEAFNNEIKDKMLNGEAFDSKAWSDKGKELSQSFTDGVTFPRFNFEIGYNYDIPDSDKKVYKYTFDLDAQPSINLNKYASGGFPETGEYFLARESGPEMVGRIGSQNAVVNNDQIVTAISQAVYNAIISAGSVPSGESQKVGIEAEDVTLSGDIIFRSFVRAHNDYVYANGSSPLDI